MKRGAFILAVALVAVTGAGAKGGAQAHLLSPLPRHAAPGKLITVRWRVDVRGPHGIRVGFSAVGMFVRLVGRAGSSTTALASENAGPSYSARVRVPRGGIRFVRFGMAGSPEFFFPLK